MLFRHIYLNQCSPNYLKELIPSLGEGEVFIFSSQYMIMGSIHTTILVKRAASSDTVWDSSWAVLDYNLNAQVAYSGHYDLDYDTAHEIAKSRIETRLKNLATLPVFPTVTKVGLTSDDKTTMILSHLDHIVEGTHR